MTRALAAHDLARASRMALLALLASSSMLSPAACGPTNDRPTPTIALVDSPGLTPVTDVNPDPDVIEFDLESGVAKVSYMPGTTTTAWTYNGTVPGPLIDAKVGDKLIVHFRNSLPQSTTIHWHGIRLPNAMDGSLSVQNPVPREGRFDYVFRFKDPGLYWFHPHHRSDEQQAKGLYGVIRVRGPKEPVVDHEHIMVLDDARLNPDGSLPGDLDDYSKLTLAEKLHGRAGPIILVNGLQNRVLDVQAGAIHRFRFLNTSNLRFFNLSIPGYTWRVIGTDGGLFEKPYDSKNLLIGPAERWDALLIPKGTPGQELALGSDAYTRSEDDPQAAAAVAKLRISKEPALDGRVLPDSLPGVAPPRLPVPEGEPMPIVFDFGFVDGIEGFKLPTHDHGGDPIMPQKGDPIFVINGKASTDIPPIEIKLGETRTFRVSNVSHQAHLFHLHGFFFQIVDTNDTFDAKLNPGGYPPEWLPQAQKDTLSVRPGYSATIVARFDELGTWMYHCHIPEHSERGMMGEIHVVP